MLNTILQGIIDSRRDEIGAAISEDKEHIRQLNVVIDAQEVLRSKLSPDDKGLIDRLEEVQSAFVALIEKEYYLAGLRDGTSLKYFLEEGVLHVAG